MDLRRWQVGEPIGARPVGRVERATKWVKRNPLVAALGALLVLSIVGGASGVFVKYLDAKEQAGIARSKAEEAEEQRKKAIAERDRAEVLTYSSRITLAQRVWQLGDAGMAWHHLESCQWNLRGWEHNYLYTQFTKNLRPLREDILSLKGHEEIVLCVAYSPDGKRIVSGGEAHSAEGLGRGHGCRGPNLQGTHGYGLPAWRSARTASGSSAAAGTTR